MCISAKNCLAVLAVGLLPLPLSAATILEPVADAQVSASNPNTNYGSAETLFGRRYTTDQWKIFVKFQLPNDAATITNATLEGMQMAAGQGGSGFLLYGVSNFSLNSWSENTITWNNAPANDTAPGNLLLAADSTYIAYKEVYTAPVGPSNRDSFVNTPSEKSTLLTLLNNSLANGGGTVTFMLSSYEFNGGGPWLASKEQSDTAFDPLILAIDYTPVPEPTVLSLLATTAILGRRRR